MAVERDSDPGRGLVRRAGSEAKTIFNEDAPTGRRVSAAVKVVGGAGALVAGSILGFDVISAIDPGLIHAAAPMLGAGGIAAAAGVGGVAVISLGGGMAIDTAYGRDGKMKARSGTRNFLRHTRTAALVAGGALGATALGMDGATLLGMAHLGPAAHGILEASFAAGGIGLAAGGGAKLWGIGIPPRKALGE